jgi:hypothetical protein
MTDKLEWPVVAVVIITLLAGHAHAGPRQCANEPNVSRRAICTECEKYAVEKFTYIFRQGCERNYQGKLTDACRAAIDRWVAAAASKKDACIAAILQEHPPRPHPMSISPEESEAPGSQDAGSPER